GRVRFVGVSNFTAAMIEECLRTRRVDVSQVGYHMLDRRQEHETFPTCLTHGIGVMGYGSLGHGLLTGAFTAATTFDPARDWRGTTDAILGGVAGRVREFTPLRPAMQPWGEEIPAGRSA